MADQASDAWVMAYKIMMAILTIILLSVVYTSAKSLYEYYFVDDTTINTASIVPRFIVIDEFRLLDQYSHGVIIKDKETSECYLALWFKGGHGPGVTNADCPKGPK